MVLHPEIEARKQRILLKREQARREFLEQQQLLAAEEAEERKRTSKEVNPLEAVKPNEKLERDRKKPKLILDSKTMISNVYRYLNQEYKYLQILNEDSPLIRPLGAIAKRTSKATGVDAKEVRTIVNEVRAKKSQQRKAERQRQRELARLNPNQIQRLF